MIKYSRSNIQLMLLFKLCMSTYSNRYRVISLLDYSNFILKILNYQVFKIQYMKQSGISKIYNKVILKGKRVTRIVIIFFEHLSFYCLTLFCVKSTSISFMSIKILLHFFLLQTYIVIRNICLLVRNCSVCSQLLFKTERLNFGCRFDVQVS